MNDKTMKCRTMTRLGRWWLAGLLGSQMISGALLAAEDADAIEELKRQIHDLDQKVRILERKEELEKEGAAEKAKTTPVVSLGSGGFSVRTADSNFVFKVRGYVQADARFYFDDDYSGGASDTFLIRRARPIFEGAVYQKFDYRVMLDFASGVNSSAANNGFLQDAYVNARLLPEIQLQIGRFKEPVGLNWHLNKNVKINLNYENTDFDGGTSGLLQNGEQVFMTRAQVSF
jgi:phosphate-selective porin OprO/OprP